MMNIKKYIIIACLVCICIFVLEKSIPRQVTLNVKQAEQYQLYELSISDHTTKKDILEMCEESEKLNQDNSTCTTFTSNNLVDYLYNCREVEDIAAIGETVIITYITNDDLKVYLTYGDIGFI